MSEPQRPTLADVTLVAVSSVALRPTVEALKASMRQANFAQVLLLSDRPPPEPDQPGIGWRPIGHIGSRREYSRFMLRDLADHIETSHALCVQWDGYVLAGQSWDERFLDYDYIGAVWPQFSDGHNVGNGGFSLRSRKLLRACRELPLNEDEAEDLVIGRTSRADLEKAGIRFAPETVARRFAFERTPPTGKEFGFHGAFNLVELNSADRALEIFRQLEPGMLSGKERLELFQWALAKRRWSLAWTMLAKTMIARLA